MSANKMHSEPVILFDGVCNFCNAAVNFVIKRDKHKVIKFASLQSEAGRIMIQRFSLPGEDMRSFLLVENNTVYNRSTAALKVCRYLNGLWPICYGMMIVPLFIRNGVYDWIAKNRYKWFGQRNECMVPTPDLKARFL
jgi:predicted DCC family thiol-disulfide oxidoreductase YuxK